MNQSIASALLDSASQDGQRSILESAELWHADGLLSIVDWATERLQSDGDNAGKVLIIIKELVSSAEFPAVAASATWQLARHHGQRASFTTAIAYADEAYTLFQENKQPLQSVRTLTLRMAAYAELGRVDEALETATLALNSLASVDNAEARTLEAMFLQNRGMTLAQSGRHSDALEEYASAAKIYDRLDDQLHQSDIAKNRGVTLLALGRANEALDYFEQATTFFNEDDHPLRRGQSLTNIAYGQMLLGQFEHSLRNLSIATTLLDEAGFTKYAAVSLLDSADVYMMSGLPRDAVSAYESASDRLRSAGMIFHLIRAQRGLGAALFSTGKQDTARKVLNEALAQAEKFGNQALHADILLELAAVVMVSGRLAAARMLAQDALDIAQAEGFPLQQTQAAFQLFDVAMEQEAYEDAGGFLESAQTSAAPLPHLQYRLKVRFGRLYERRQAFDDAKAAYRDAIKLVENLRYTLKQEAMRIAFIGDKLAAYEGLILLHLEQGDLLQALTVAELSKSRTLVDMMERKLDTPDLNQRIEASNSIAEMRQTLNALYNQLLDDSGEQRGTLQSSDSVAIHTQAVALENEIRLLKIASFENSDSYDLASVQDGKAPAMPDTPVAAYHVLGDELLAFVQVDGELRVKRHISSMAIVVELIELWQVQLRRLRVGGAFVERHIEKLTQAAERILHRLYEELIAPIESMLPESEAPQPLLIVPHGALHQLPLHALYDGTRYLLERFVISYVPSLTVYQLTQRALADSGQPESAAIFGVSDPQLHAVAAEAEQISQQFDDAMVYLDGDATFEAFREQSTADVIHIATHGIHRSDHPSFSGFRLHDCWVSADDVSALRFDESLVVISACESGRIQVDNGDEPLGLPRAFLGAGASALMVSLWLIKDDISAEMMPLFYQNLRAGLSRTASLRAAQLDCKSRHPHPFHWAAFVLVGQN